MSTRVIFTDIDGVLTTVRTKFRTGDIDCVRRLNRLVEETDAVLVISSTWRIGGKENIEQKLREWGVMATISDVTPDLSEMENAIATGVERGDEIQAWLDTHPKVRRFCILDDDRDMVHLMANLVLTNSYIGLQDKDVEIARTILIGE